MMNPFKSIGILEDKIFPPSFPPKKFPESSCYRAAEKNHNTIANAVKKRCNFKERKIVMANKPVVPNAKEAMNKFKMEAANEVGVFSPLKLLHLRFCAGL